MYEERRGKGGYPNPYRRHSPSFRQSLASLVSLRAVVELAPKAKKPACGLVTEKTRQATTLASKQSKPNASEVVFCFVCFVFFFKNITTSLSST